MSVGGSAEVFIPLQLKRLDFHVVTERPTEQKRPNFPVPLFMLVFRCCLVRAVPFKRARELYCPPPVSRGTAPFHTCWATYLQAL